MSQKDDMKANAVKLQKGLKKLGDKRVVALSVHKSKGIDCGTGGYSRQTRGADRRFELALKLARLNKAALRVYDACG